MDFPPVSLSRLGTKRVVWRDFMDIARQCKQPWKQVWEGISREIGAPPDVIWTDDNEMAIRGRWSPDVLNKALQDYVKHGLTCTQCHKIVLGLPKRKVCGPCYSSDGKMYALIGSVTSDSKETAFDLGREFQQYYDGWEFGGDPLTKTIWFFNVPKQHADLAQQRAAKKKYTLSVSEMEGEDE